MAAENETQTATDHRILDMNTAQRSEHLRAVLQATFADSVAAPLPKDMLDLVNALDGKPRKRSGFDWLRGRGR